MKRLLLPLLFIVGLMTATSCFTKSLSPKYLKGSWYVFEDPTTKYTFVDDTLMYIDGKYEGDAYRYSIEDDTITYTMIGDEPNEILRLYLDVSGVNTMFASDGKTGFILRRKK